MRVIVDAAACQGHARCFAEAPAIFDLDDLGYAQVRVTGLLDAEQEAVARRGAAACPERAISLVEDEGEGDPTA